MPLPFLESVCKNYILEKKNWPNPAMALKDAIQRSEFVGYFLKSWNHDTAKTNAAY